MPMIDTRLSIVPGIEVGRSLRDGKRVRYLVGQQEGLSDSFELRRKMSQTRNCFYSCVFGTIEPERVQVAGGAPQRPRTPFNWVPRAKALAHVERNFRPFLVQRSSDTASCSSQER